MGEFIEIIHKIKKIKFIIIIGGIAFAFLLLMTVIYEITDGKFNLGQSVDQNAQSGYKGESGNVDTFSTLCENCTTDPNNINKDGVMGSKFYEKTSEMMNLYNNLEEEKQRDDEFDFALLAMTIQYQKHFRPELFSDATNYGTAMEENLLTNRDIDQFPNVFEINKENVHEYTKWAEAMLGTPYSLPDANLRGLSGNLISGRVTTECNGDGTAKSKDEQENDLIKQIVEVEKKFAGETVQEPGFWNSILTFLGIPYKSDDKLLLDRLTAMFDDDPDYEDLKTYVNLDNYDPYKCTSGGSPVHTYTKFMNYEQYKVYLRTVFIPQNYINCEQCVFKNAAKDVKDAKVEQIINDIFQSAEDYRRYANMKEFDYDNIVYGEQIENTDLLEMTSPLKSACKVNWGYGYRDGVMHSGIDSIFLSSDRSIHAIYGGDVVSVNYYYTETFPCTDKNCPCAGYTNIENGGITIIIKHEINGTTYYSQYAHLSPDGIEVEAGAHVDKGQKIANMGTTGCSSGVHLHFDLFKGELNEANKVNPIALFSKCENSGVSWELKLTTTDNFVTPEKCMIGKYSLDEAITGIIKDLDKTLSEQKEAVKATAIVIRTAIMHDSNWCNDKSQIHFDADVDIENNISDLNLYNQVIETQGMVLNYSGENIDNAKYLNFPCYTIPQNDWYNHQDIVFRKISRSYDENGDLDEDKILADIKEYNAGCVDYQDAGSKYKITLYTIPQVVYENSNPKIEPHVDFLIPKDWVKDTTHKYQAINYFSSTQAKYLASTGDDYTEILYRFYQAKAINKLNFTVAHGVVDISTAPGLIDAKKLVSEKLGDNKVGFKYGITLSGSNRIPPASSEDLEQINNNLNEYLKNAEAIAKSENADVAKTKIAAAAYWLVNNNYYKVQYGANNLSLYDVNGWNPEWNEKYGVDSLGFVLWSLKQAGSTNSAIQNPRRTSEKFTVEELINGGIQVGDIISRVSSNNNGTKTANSHWAVVIEVSDYYIKVAHAVNEQTDLTITSYSLGEEINYQYLY